MVETFSKWNVEAKFVMEFDKNNLEDEFFQCIVFPEDNLHLHRPLSQYISKAGELSLATKNFWVYYWLLKNDAENAFIIEDDAEVQLDLDEPVRFADYYFPKDENETIPNNNNYSSLIKKYGSFIGELGNLKLNSMLRRIKKMVPPNFSILQLGSCLHNRFKDVEFNVRELAVSLGDSAHCTSAYVISKQGAIQMFKSMPIAHPIDQQMCAGWGGMHHPDFSSYGVWPVHIFFN